jgi:hypothetical protein
MYQTRNSYSFQQPAADERAQSRLNWLLAENEREANRRVFRNSLEEEEVLLMSRPIPTRKAYGRFGLLLGTLPPAAIFLKLFGYGIPGLFEDVLFPLLLCLGMNVVCALVGRWMGLVLARPMEKLERGSWIKMLLLSPFIGFAWALLTGAAGGAVALLFGAVYGAIFAIPVGLLAFTFFPPLHRLLARGGMIDARHFWPLACGVVLMITALILGM